MHKPTRHVRNSSGVGRVSSSQQLDLCTLPTAPLATASGLQRSQGVGWFTAAGLRRMPGQRLAPGPPRRGEPDIAPQGSTESPAPAKRRANTQLCCCSRSVVVPRRVPAAALTSRFCSSFPLAEHAWLQGWGRVCLGRALDHRAVTGPHQ